jgi:hypothetical protein|tara:strand:+ start:134 stop:310 length:177 start_codon:yes stop_codon:yes gene_type:complete
MVEYDTPMKGQRYIRDCRAKVLQDVTVYLQLLPKKVGKDEIVRKITQIITNNFKSLEQ